MQILIVGASGSGTTTLGHAIAKRLSWKHLDLDDDYWVATSPPFQHKRDPAERLHRLLADLRSAPDAVASGSPVGWGEPLEDAFDLVVFLYVPAGLRLQRLQTREVQRYGQADPAFLLWASQYEEGPPEGRSLAKHLAWLTGRKCPVLRIEGDTSIDERVDSVLEAIRGFDAAPA